MADAMGSVGGAVEPSRALNLGGPARYILNARIMPGELPFTTLLFGRGETGGSFQIPAVEDTRYLLEVGSDGITIDMPEALSFSAGPFRWLDWPFVLRNARQRDRFWLPLGPGTALAPLLRWRGRESTELLRSIRNMRGWGFTLPSASLQYALTRRWQAPEAAGSQVSARGQRIGVVVHLYYRELWPEFETVLKRIAQPFELVITITEDDRSFEAQVHSAFPKARIVVYENKGRDVAPFLQLLHDGHLDGFDLVCKLHGKRSAKRGPRAILGAVWRWTLLRELIGSTAVVQGIVDRFVDDPRVGMIGPRRLRLPNQHMGEKGAWGDNADTVHTLAERLGLSREAVKLDFFAGTMFWVRRDVLDLLKRLDLSMDDFAAESGTVDGALEHALERLFGVAVVAAGMTIDDVSDDPAA